MYSLLATPEVASVAASESWTGPSYLPPGPGWAGDSVAVVLGATLSTLTVRVLVASTLLFLSVERYSIVCVPAVVTAIGAL
jgi:hypothetical protein